MTSYAEIDPLPAEFLWQDRIPLCMVTVMAAKAKTGKGLLIDDIAARVTRGDDMPDGTPGIDGSVVMVTLEDDPVVVMANRLKAANADMSRIHDFTTVESGEDFYMGDDMPELERFIQSIGDVRLLVIDPLNAAAMGMLRSDKAVRKDVMGKAAKLAKDQGLAVVFIHHTVKSGAVAGSQAIVDAARSLLMVNRDEGDPVRHLHLERSNVAPDDVPDIRYTISGEGSDVAVEYLLSDTETTGGLGLGPGQAAVLDALQLSRTPLDTLTISHQIGASYGSTRVMVHKMAKAGLLASPKRGLWELAPSERHPVAPITGGRPYSVA